MLPGRRIEMISAPAFAKMSIWRIVLLKLKRVYSEKTNFQLIQITEWLLRQ